MPRLATDAGTPPSSKMRRAAAILARYGAPALLLSWVPLIGDALVLLAGAAHTPFWTFSTWTVLGKGARYVVVAIASD